MLSNEVCAAAIFTKVAAFAAMAAVLFASTFVLSAVLLAATLVAKAARSSFN